MELFSFGQHGFKTTFGLLRYYTNDEGDLRTDRVIPLHESAVEAEQGYKFINEFQTRNNGHTHTLTAYSHYIRNFIFTRPLAIIGTFRGPTPLFIVDQADAFFAGVDYSWKQQWSKQVFGTFTGSYLWPRNVEKNEVLINQPPLNVEYKLSWTLPLWGKMKGLFV